MPSDKPTDKPQYDSAPIDTGGTLLATAGHSPASSGHKRPSDAGQPTDNLPEMARHTTTDLLSWGLFWRYSFIQSGVLFLLAGILCFFAFNWAAIPSFAKFGLIMGLMLASAGVTLARGADSSEGGMGLLFCALLAGPLVAVYGQVYQTGANASELFLTWGIFLLPLALASKRASLWLALWLVVTVWLSLYCQERFMFFSEDWNSFFGLYSITDQATRDAVIKAQLAILIVWEAASYLLAGPSRGFLYSRMLPRLVALLFLCLLTWALCEDILTRIERFSDAGYISLAQSGGYLLSLACLAVGGYWYSRRRPDALILAMGMLSIIVVGLFFVFSHEDMWNVGGAFSGAFSVIGAAFAAERLLRMHRAYSLPFRSAWKTRRLEAAIWLESKREAQKKKKAARVLPSLFNWQALQFALTSRLPGAAPANDTKAMKATPSPWFARVLIGLCAWIALPLLLAGFALLLFDVLHFQSAWAYFTISLIAMGLGAVLCASRSLFAQQFGLGLSLAGTVGASLSAMIELRLDADTILLPALALCAAGFFAVKNRAYRFGAALAFFCLLSMQISLIIFPFYGYRLFTADQEQLQILAQAARIYGLIFFSALGLLVTYLHFLPEDKARKLPHLDILRTALLISLACLPFLRFTPYLLPIETPFLRMSGFGAGLGLGLYVVLLLRPFRVAAATYAFFLVAAAAVTFAGWHYPWISTGFLLLALARQGRSLPLAGLATAFLVVFITTEYYLLNTSLLMKALYLCLTGLALLAAGLAVTHRLTRGITAGRLPEPLSLFQGISFSVPGTLAAPGKETAASQKPDTGSLPPEDLPDTNGLALASPANAFHNTPRIDALRHILIAVVVAVFLGAFGLSVQAKEKILAEGTVIRFALMPVDPRSLMQGDYMTLNFALTNEVRDAFLEEFYSLQPAAKRGSPESLPPALPGKAVITLDAQGVASFVRFAKAEEPLEEGELFLNLKWQKLWVKVASSSFFFQEGHADYYANARFAELRLDENGTTLITHLLDKDMRRIEPEKEEKNELLEQEKNE